MSAGNNRACFIGLGITAAQNLLHGCLVHLLGDAHNIQRQLRLSAHSVNIAQSVRRRNLSVHKGIIDNRRKEIRCLHNRQLVAHLVNAGIVAFIVAY